MPLREWHILYEPRPVRRIVWLAAGFGCLGVSFWMLRGYDTLTMYLAKLLLVACGWLWSLVPRAKRTGIGSFVPVSRNGYDWLIRYAGAACLIVGLFAPRIAGGFNGEAVRYWVTGGRLMAVSAGMITQYLRKPSERYDFIATGEV